MAMVNNQRVPCFTPTLSVLIFAERQDFEKKGGDWGSEASSENQGASIVAVSHHKVGAGKNKRKKWTVGPKSE